MCDRKPCFQRDLSSLQEIILLADPRSKLYAYHKITNRCERDADLLEVILFDALQPISLLRGSFGSSNVTLLARLDPAGLTGNPGNGAGPRFNNNEGIYDFEN